MRFAKWVFLLAGIFGVIMILPLYFSESTIAPNIQYPLFYYGFIGLDLVWQLLYIFISTNPVRYRHIMLFGFLAKFLGVVSILWLILQHRVDTWWLGIVIIDLFIAVLFLISYWTTRQESTEKLNL